MYIISAEHASDIEKFITERGFNIFTTVILEDVLIIYHGELVNDAEKDIYEKMHKSPYRNYLNKKRPDDHAVVYMMSIDKTEKIEKLVSEIKESEVYDELKILSYPSREYRGYSYIKIYNKNASVKNMRDYLMNAEEFKKVVTLGDNERNKADYKYSSCDEMVRKMRRLFFNSKM